MGVPQYSGVSFDFSAVPGSLAGVELDLPIGKNDGDAWTAETGVKLEHDMIKGP